MTYQIHSQTEDTNFWHINMLLGQKNKLLYSTLPEKYTFDLKWFLNGFTGLVIQSEPCIGSIYWAMIGLETQDQEVENSYSINKI